MEAEVEARAVARQKAASAEAAREQQEAPEPVSEPAAAAGATDDGAAADDGLTSTQRSKLKKAELEAKERQASAERAPRRAARGR